MALPVCSVSVQFGSLHLPCSSLYKSSRTFCILYPLTSVPVPIRETSTSDPGPHIRGSTFLVPFRVIIYLSMAYWLVIFWECLHHRREIVIFVDIQQCDFIFQNIYFIRFSIKECLLSESLWKQNNKKQKAPLNIKYKFYLGYYYYSFYYCIFIIFVFVLYTNGCKIRSAWKIWLTWFWHVLFLACCALCLN